MIFVANSCKLLVATPCFLCDQICKKVHDSHIQVFDFQTVWDIENYHFFYAGKFRSVYCSYQVL